MMPADQAITSRSDAGASRHSAMQPPSGWTDIACQFAVDIAGGDLAGRIYAVDHAWLIDQDPQLRGLDHCDGLAGPLAFLLQPTLQRLGLWHGPGRTMTIRWTGSWQHAIGICLHESAHLIADRMRPAGSPHQLDDVELQAVRGLAAAYADSMQSRQQPLPWTGHGSRFVRCCCHLWHRGHQRMQSLRPQHLRFGDRYFGHPFGESVWVQSLADELTDTDQPISAILDSPPPPLFVERYHQATGVLPDDDE